LHYLTASLLQVTSVQDDMKNHQHFLVGEMAEWKRHKDATIFKVRVFSEQ